MVYITRLPKFSANSIGVFEHWAKATSTSGGHRKPAKCYTAEADVVIKSIGERGFEE